MEILIASSIGAALLLLGNRLNRSASLRHRQRLASLHQASRPGAADSGRPV